jgi:hypothetical protein
MVEIEAVGKGGACTGIKLRIYKEAALISVW